MKRKRRRIINAGQVSVTSFRRTTKALLTGDDLKAMLAQFAGQRFVIQGATFRDVRESDTTLRFELDLKAGFSLSNFPIMGISSAGSYAVVFDKSSGQFVAQRMTPPDAKFSSFRISDDTVALKSTTINIGLENSGLQDLSALPLVLTAAQNGRDERVVDQRTVELLGRSQQSINIAWTPPEAGTWVMTAHFYLPDDNTIERQFSIVVAKPQVPTWQQVYRRAWPRAEPTILVAALMGLAGIAVAGGLMLGGRIRERHAD